jgi:hypothetical protein
MATDCLLPQLCIMLALPAAAGAFSKSRKAITLSFSLPCLNRNAVLVLAVSVALLLPPVLLPLLIPTVLPAPDE